MTTRFDPTRTNSGVGLGDSEGNAYKEGRRDSSTSDNRRVNDVFNETFQKQENPGTGSSERRGFHFVDEDDNETFQKQENQGTESSQ